MATTTLATTQGTREERRTFQNQTCHAVNLFCINRTGENVYNKHTIVTKKIDCAPITSVRQGGFTVIWELVPRVTEKLPLSVLTGVRFVLSGLILAKIHERSVEKNGTVRYVRVSEEPGTPNENMVQNHLNKALLNVF